jgi:hypothetical protein
MHLNPVGKENCWFEYRLSGEEGPVGTCDAAREENHSHVIHLEKYISSLRTCWVAVQK